MLQRIKGKLDTHWMGLYPQKCVPVYKNENGDIFEFQKDDYLIVLNLDPEMDYEWYSVSEPILVWEGFITDCTGELEDWECRMGKDWIFMFHIGYDSIVVRKAISIAKQLEWENE